MILVSGSSGFVGSALVPALKTEGYSVLKLKRGNKTSTQSDEVFWQPGNAHSLVLPSPTEAVIHLAGENVFGLWTTSKKQKIFDSRVRDTQALVDGLSRQTTLPKVFICASAIGFYGNQGSRPLDESNPSGEGFLAHVCEEWEKASQGLVSKGVRTIQLRVGVVLDPGGGVLQKLKPIFRLGLGGPLGDGSHFVSWISLTDLVRATIYCLKNEKVEGPVNGVSPQPVTNLEFTKSLAKALRSPAFLPVPAPLLKFLLKDFATEAILTSQRIYPKKLEASGFNFQNPALDAFLLSATKT